MPATRGELFAGVTVAIVTPFKSGDIDWDALDPASNPDYVMLLANSDFENAPSVRAIWSGKNVLERNNRSTVFGFTSNLPPVVGREQPALVSIG